MPSFGELKLGWYRTFGQQHSSAPGSGVTWSVYAVAVQTPLGRLPAIVSVPAVRRLLHDEGFLKGPDDRWLFDATIQDVASAWAMTSGRVVALINELRELDEQAVEQPVDASSVLKRTWERSRWLFAFESLNLQRWHPWLAVDELGAPGAAWCVALLQENRAPGWWFSGRGRGLELSVMPAHCDYYERLREREVPSAGRKAARWAEEHAAQLTEESSRLGYPFTRRQGKVDVKDLQQAASSWRQKADQLGVHTLVLPDGDCTLSSFGDLVEWLRRPAVLRFLALLFPWRSTKGFPLVSGGDYVSLVARRLDPLFMLENGDGRARLLLAATEEEALAELGGDDGWRVTGSWESSEACELQLALEEE